MARNTLLTTSAALLLVGLVKAGFGDRGHWGGGDYDGDGNHWWDGGDNDDGNDGSTSAASTNGFGLGSVEDFNRASKILIAHAVIASLVWVMFIPSAAILLRVGLKNPIVLKLHAILQILSYLLYVVAAAMGKLYQKANVGQADIVQASGSPSKRHDSAYGTILILALDWQFLPLPL